MEEIIKKLDKKFKILNYEYIDENGEKQKGSATKEMITQTLAAADAAGQLEESMMELKKEMRLLEKMQKQDYMRSSSIRKYFIR